MKDVVVSSSRTIYSVVLVLLKLISTLIGRERRIQARLEEQERRLIIGRSDKPASTSFEGYEGARIWAFQVSDATGHPLGVLKLWYDQRTGVCRREFSVCDRSVVAALGTRRMPLPPIKLRESVDLVREQSLREVEGMLRTQLPMIAALKASTTSAAPVAAVAVAPCVQPPPPAPAAREQARPQVSAPARVVRQQGARAQHVDEGVLKAYGIDTRRISDRDNPGEMTTIKQFYVDLMLTSGDNPGMPKRIWGADLERVISEAKVHRGDAIRVAHLGRTKVSCDGNERPSYKNVYEVTKL